VIWMPRSVYPFDQHDPYRHIGDFFLTVQQHPNLYSAIEIHREHIQSLQLNYGFFTPCSIDYNYIFSQNAYMLLYYPLYIETIAHVLSRIHPELLQSLFSDDVDVCIYGGGAIPEFFGFLYFIDEIYRDNHSLQFHIFDLYNWITWRDYLVRHMTPDYWSHEIPAVIPYHIDFCSLTSNSAYDPVPIIRTAKIHIFQNCLTEFIQRTGTIANFKVLFQTFLDQIPVGSIVIFINIVNFDHSNPASGMDVQARLQDIEAIMRDNNIGETLHPISFYDPYFYNPNICRNNIPCIEINPRSESKYHTLVIRKTATIGRTS